MRNSSFLNTEKSPRSFDERLLFEPEKHHFQLCDDAEVTMSALTRYLSRLLGVFLLVTAASEWTQPGLLTVVAPAMVDQPALLWVSGMLTFASGLAIVLGHNVWGNPAAAVVSLLGWMMTIKGAALLLVPPSGLISNPSVRLRELPFGSANILEKPLQIRGQLQRAAARPCGPRRSGEAQPSNISRDMAASQESTSKQLESVLGTGLPARGPNIRLHQETDWFS